MTIPVSVTTRSGAWLRSTAAGMAGRLLKRAGVGKDENVGGFSADKKVIDGFIVSATRTGERARGLIVDPPGTVALAGDAFNVWGGVPGAPPAYESALVTRPRDNYSPVFQLPIPETPTPPATGIPELVPRWRPRLSKGLAIEGGEDQVELFRTWSFPTNESPVGVHRAEIACATPVAQGQPYGGGTETHYLSLTLRSGYPAGAQRIVVSENYIAARTGGFRLQHRTYAGGGSELPATVNLPQIPMTQCHWDAAGRFVMAAVAVSKSARPTDPTAWREDAGTGGVLVVKIAFDDDGDPYWAWHHLLDFDATSDPALKAEEWLPAWEATQPPGGPAVYPVAVSGNVQNSVRSLCAAGSDAGEGEFCVFFTTMHGRQGSDGGGVQLHQQHALVSLRVSATSETPSAVQTVLLRDVSAGSASPVYAAYGNGDAAVARSWTLRGCEYLLGTPVALASSTPLERPADGMHWLANEVYNTGAYVSAEPVSELLALAPAAVLLTQPAAAVGASLLYRWAAGVPTTPRSVPLRFVKHTTKVADGRMLLSAYKYPDAEEYPAFRVLAYDATTNEFSVAIDAPARNFGAWWGFPPPPLALTCYQREVRDGGGEVTTPYCILLSYWNLRLPSPPATIDQYTLLSTDGGATVSPHLTHRGAAHGAHYIGSATWRPTYTRIFEGTR